MDLYTYLPAFECGKLFTYKPMSVYMRGALIFGNKPNCGNTATGVSKLNKVHVVSSSN